MKRFLPVLPAILVALAGLTASAAATGDETPVMRLVLGFENPLDLPAMERNAENARLALCRDQGVTEGAVCLKVSAAKGADWASILLPAEAIAGWDKVQAVTADVTCQDSAKIGLRFELWDARSTNQATRCTLWNAEIGPGKQTFRWELAQCRRNRKESALWESLDEADKIDLAHLAKVKLFLTPPKDRDYVFYLDNVRLVMKTPAQLAAERDAAGRAGGKLILFRSDFEDGKGLGGKAVPFKGNWLGLGEVAIPCLEAPLGKGNGSKLACTVHAGKSADSVACELPLHHTEMEPPGWDATVSVKVYNGGFAGFYVQYSPIWPSDTTFHRAYFTVPKGQWAEVVLPFDKFLYHGRRPRRGSAAEYICITGTGPESEQSVFQFDDFVAYRTRREGYTPSQPKAALPAGVAYQQDFDDPDDIDVEGFYPTNNKTNVFRVAGGLGADGKHEDLAKTPARGCLKIECYQRRAVCQGGRRDLRITADMVVEFDCLLKGVTGLGVGARGKDRHRAVLDSQPKQQQWTHCSMLISQLKPQSGEALWEINFFGQADESDENCVLIDNLRIRQVPASNPP